MTIVEISRTYTIIDPSMTRLVVGTANRASPKEVARAKKIAASIDKVMAEPTKADLAVNVTKAAWAWAAAGLPVVTQLVYDGRRAICDACEHWDATAFLGMGKCKACGCSSLKLWLATSRCPLKKWPGDAPA